MSLRTLATNTPPATAIARRDVGRLDRSLAILSLSGEVLIEIDQRGELIECDQPVEVSA